MELREVRASLSNFASLSRALSCSFASELGGASPKHVKDMAQGRTAPGDSPNGPTVPVNRIIAGERTEKEIYRTHQHLSTLTAPVQTPGLR